VEERIKSLWRKVLTSHLTSPSVPYCTSSYHIFVRGVSKRMCVIYCFVFLNPFTQVEWSVVRDANITPYHRTKSDTPRHHRCDSIRSNPTVTTTTHQSEFIDSNPATTTTTNHRDRQIYRDLRVLLPLLPHRSIIRYCIGSSSSSSRRNSWGHIHYQQGDGQATSCRPPNFWWQQLLRSRIEKANCLPADVPCLTTTIPWSYGIKFWNK